MRLFPQGEKYPGFFERPASRPTAVRLRDNRDVRPPREAMEHLSHASPYSGKIHENVYSEALDTSLENALNLLRQGGY